MYQLNLFINVQLSTSAIIFNDFLKKKSISFRVFRKKKFSNHTLKDETNMRQSYCFWLNCLLDNTIENWFAPLTLPHVDLVWTLYPRCDLRLSNLAMFLPTASIRNFPISRSVSRSMKLPTIYFYRTPMWNMCVILELHLDPYFLKHRFFKITMGCFSLLCRS